MSLVRLALDDYCSRVQYKWAQCLIHNASVDMVDTLRARHVPAEQSTSVPVMEAGWLAGWERVRDGGESRSCDTSLACPPARPHAHEIGDRITYHL